MPAIAPESQLRALTSSTPPATPPLDLIRRGALARSMSGLRGRLARRPRRRFCQRLVDAGFPARRFSMIIGTLHPRHGARSYVWRPAGLETEAFARRRTDEESDAYLRSPIYYLRSSGRGTAAPAARHGRAARVPAARGAARRRHDRIRRAHRALRRRRHGVAQSGPADVGDGRFDPLQGIFFSCATDVPGGFDDDQLEQVADALPHLALAVKSRSTFDVARTLLETYLGADAGHRVLTGEIDRHSVQRIRAVIWFCDLRGFSTRREPRGAGGARRDPRRLPRGDGAPGARPPGADPQVHGRRLSRDVRLSRSATARAVCARRARRQRELLDYFPPFNAERRAAGKRTLDFGVALHLGRSALRQHRRARSASTSPSWARR